ncbi:ketoacyl-ACP synthase III [Evansella sp. AB-rgal1]|uniref:ketoacyl-ACP synthase III n=1 Tax=Evansella sp. AB-rgal1 TaxID=3242696 RepID=UPI00359D9396
MNNSKFIGFGTFLPGEPITNSVMEEIFRIRKDWIEEMIGTKTRYFATDFYEKEIRYSLTDICKNAAQIAIEDAGIQAEEIDLIVMSTATPDHIMPATVNLVANELGLNNIPTYQVQSGCSGALQGLEVAYQFLASGKYHNALVIGGDVCNKYLDLDRDFTKLRAHELINYALFGDGAGAAVLSTSTEKEGIKIENIINRFEGLDRIPGQIMNWFGVIPEKSHDMNPRERRKNFQSAKEDYKAIEQNVPVMAEQVLNELLEKGERYREDIDFYLPPQLGGNMTNKINEYLNIPQEKGVNCVENTGNNGNALPYIQLNLLKERMSKGDTAVVIAIESSKWIKTGMTLVKE